MLYILRICQENFEFTMQCLLSLGVSVVIFIGQSVAGADVCLFIGT